MRLGSPDSCYLLTCLLGLLYVCLHAIDLIVLKYIHYIHCKCINVYYCNLSCKTKTDSNQICDLANEDAYMWQNGVSVSVNDIETFDITNVYGAKVASYIRLWTCRQHLLVEMYC